MPYIIDGHNLISYLPDIDLSDPHDEAKLVYKLRGFAARKQKRVIVIFDAGIPGGIAHNLSTHSVKAIFAAAGHTNADNIIKERVRKAVDVRAWTVVTSDREVIAAARARDMRVMRCADFAQLLISPAREMPEPGEENHVALTPFEIEEWLRIFGYEEGDEAIPDQYRHIDPPPKIRRLEPEAHEMPDEMPEEKPLKKQPPDELKEIDAHPELNTEDIAEWMQYVGEDYKLARKPVDTESNYYQEILPEKRQQKAEREANARQERKNQPRRKRSDHVPKPEAKRKKRRHTGQEFETFRAEPNDNLSEEDINEFMRYFGEDD